MGMEKRTVKIIVIVVVTLLVLGGIIGLLLGLLLPIRYVQLEVWPRSEEYGTWEEPFIHMRKNDPSSWHPWVERINYFLREYETMNPEEPPRAPCSTKRSGMHHNLRSSMCDQAMRMWVPCTADYQYGYSEGQPCVFLRLSHMQYWVPEPYNNTVPLPPEMPEQLVKVLHERPALQYGDHIWLTCDGEFHADKENIGTIKYIPEEYLPGFPTRRLHTADKINRNTRSMVDEEAGPLIAILFMNPTRGVVINVECRVWSRDLYYYYDHYSKIGRARFELFIE